MINRIVLVGRLVADPEERFTNDGVAIAKFRIAVDRFRRGSDGEKEADFLNIVCFRKSAEFVNRYCSRGDLVGVEGRLQIDQYTDRDGNRRDWVEISADNVQKLSRSEGGGGGGGGRGRDRDWDHEEDKEDDSRARPGRGDDRGQAREERSSGDRAPAREERGSGDRAPARDDRDDRSGGSRRQRFEKDATEAPAEPVFEDDESDPFAEE